MSLQYFPRSGTSVYSAFREAHFFLLQQGNHKAEISLDQGLIITEIMSTKIFSAAADANLIM